MTATDPVLPAPDHPLHPGQRLEPFVPRLRPPNAHRVSTSHPEVIEIKPGTVEVHPDLPELPIWGYAREGRDATTPGPLLEVDAGELTTLRFDNRLPASTAAGSPPPDLPFLTNVAPDPLPNTDDPQTRLGTEGAVAQDVSMVPIGWTAVHLHGGHTRPQDDGWPDDMTRSGGSQVCTYDNTYDNADLGLTKVGAMQWYHDHAMNGTRYHVFSGLAAGYLVRDPAEADLGLPTSAEDGEIVLVVQDRNVGAATGDLTAAGTDGDGDDDDLRLLHKTTESTAEFFGPLTLVNGLLWPRLSLRPNVFRLRVLNGSNARSYRFHLVALSVDAGGATVVTSAQHRLLVIGTDGGLLWRAWVPGDEGLTLAPAERLDLLLDLTGLADGEHLHLVNSAPAPFGGDPVPDLTTLVNDGNADGLNPYPQVLRFDVRNSSSDAGAAGGVVAAVAAAELNPAFKRLVHEDPGPVPPDEPTPFVMEGHAHHTILLAESDPPGHLYLHELVADPAGHIELQLPGETAPSSYSVVGWAAGETAESFTRPSFYDRIGILPELGEWQVFRFVNTTGDTHPLHIHQSQFQPLDDVAGRIVYADATDTNLYDPTLRVTSSPLVPDTAVAGRSYELHETTGWKDVIRVDPGNVVKVAIRFDLPGRYVYHCHVIEHEDTEMMRPFVVTVTAMGHHGMP